MAVILALLGYSINAVGIVLQKKGSVWMKIKEKKDSRFILNLFIWGSGMLLSYVISVLPNGIASNYLPPHVVSAVSGWGIVAVVIFSYLFLKEKLYSSDLLYALLIAVSILVISLLQKSSQQYHINELAMDIMIYVPFLVLIPGFIKQISSRARTVILSSYAGLGGGLSIVLLNIAVKHAGTDVSGYINSPYIYIYFIIGIATLISMQVAYRLGDIMLIAPTQMSISIVYPVLCTYFIYGIPLNTVQIFFIFVIVFSCFSILRKH